LQQRFLNRSFQNGCKFRRLRFFATASGLMIEKVRSIAIFLKLQIMNKYLLSG